MFDTATERELLTKATSGDRRALATLLLAYYDQLTEHITRTMSPRNQGYIGVDDIIQETFVQVIQDIEQFTPRSDHAYYAWLKTIADHRLQDAIRGLKRDRREGDPRQVGKRALPRDGAVADLVEMLTVGSHTPSGSAARHEAVAAIQQTIDELPEGYRQAVQLRLLAGKSLPETAAIMNRSPRAVQGLLDRAKKKMRVALGRLSHYQ
jgi:RNA polymerase sigma-70 factor (ECF subfamily)